MLKSRKFVKKSEIFHKVSNSGKRLSMISEEVEESSTISATVESVNTITTRNLKKD